MTGQHTSETPERHELRHEARPGYKTVFIVVFAAGIVYLALVFGLGLGAH